MKRGFVLSRDRSIIYLKLFGCAEKSTIAKRINSLGTSGTVQVKCADGSRTVIPRESDASVIWIRIGT
jgi:hypothetical protein